MRLLIAVALAAILLWPASSLHAGSVNTTLQVAQAAACPSGKITCKEWCRRYNSESRLCLTGHPNSCDKKTGGENACVDDKPRKATAPTCSAHNAECTAFCSTPDGKAQGKACPNACAERMRTCLQTGTYAWRNRPTATGLERK